MKIIKINDTDSLGLLRIPAHDFKSIDPRTGLQVTYRTLNNIWMFDRKIRMLSDDQFEIVGEVEDDWAEKITSEG